MMACSLQWLGYGQHAQLCTYSWEVSWGEVVTWYPHYTYWGRHTVDQWLKKNELQLPLLILPTSQQLPTKTALKLLLLSLAFMRNFVSTCLLLLVRMTTLICRGLREISDYLGIQVMINLLDGRMLQRCAQEWKYFWTRDIVTAQLFAQYIVVPMKKPPIVSKRPFIAVYFVSNSKCYNDVDDEWQTVCYVLECTIIGWNN